MWQLLEAARQEGVKRFVFSSSAAVYGDSAACPQSEDGVTALITPYEISKLESEHDLEFYRRQWGLSTVSLRYFNVYGPGQNPQSQYAAVIPRRFQRAREGSPLLVHGDGLRTRDFVHVSDVARANLWASLRGELHGPCNVSTGHPTPIVPLLQTARTDPVEASRAPWCYFRQLQRVNLSTTARPRPAPTRPGRLRPPAAPAAAPIGAGRSL